MDKSLLVNGVKVDTTGFETLARGLQKFFADTKLNSITFTKQVSFGDLLEFITASIQVPASDNDTPLWSTVVKEKKISGIFFNQQVYDVMEEQAGSAVVEVAAEENPDAKTPPMEDEDVKKIPQHLRQLFLTGDRQGVMGLM